MTELLFINASQVVTCAGPPRARRGAEMQEAGVRTGVAVAVRGQTIARVGPQEALLREFAGAELVDCAGGLLTPGLVDSHTHAIFGRARFEEQEMRAAGLGYMEIATRGGGIHASVRDLRGRSEEELTVLAADRLRRLAAHGTTTVEVKSGYGLTVEDELKRSWHAQPRFSLVILTVFAAIGLLLVAIGVYGVMAYAVSRRSQEFAIRMALGASQQDVLRAVLTSGAWLLGIGIVAGLVASQLTNRVVSSAVLNTDRIDVASGIAAVVVIVVVGVAACLIPARRAARTSPMQALRQD